MSYSNADGGMNGNAAGKPPVASAEPRNITVRPPMPRQEV